MMARPFVAAALALAAMTCAQADPLAGYRPASAEERPLVIGAISYYYELRNHAAVTGDLAPLYRAHPALAQGQDRRSGVNVESFFVERMRALGVTHVAVDLEASEPVKIYLSETKAVAYVHGRETWDLLPGSGQTIGEIRVRLDLLHGPSGWTVERTDEVEQGETLPPTPR
jgi:hypothetical protein